MNEFKIDLFSVGRRTFPEWPLVQDLQTRLAKNSLIGFSHDQMNNIREKRAERLTELIDEEHTSGLVYYCERYWLESFAQSNYTYEYWLHQTLFPFIQTENLNNENGYLHHLGLNAFRLPPLLSERTKKWVNYSYSEPKCSICTRDSNTVNRDWLIQAAHLLHNLNYYLEMLNDDVRTEELRNEYRPFYYVFLTTNHDNSQVWDLGIHTEYGDYPTRFFREEILTKGYQPSGESSPCWYPGCTEEISDSLSTLVYKTA